MLSYMLCFQMKWTQTSFNGAELKHKTQTLIRQKDSQNHWLFPQLISLSKTLFSLGFHASAFCFSFLTLRNFSLPPLPPYPCFFLPPLNLSLPYLTLTHLYNSGKKQRSYLAQKKVHQPALGLIAVSNQIVARHAQNFFFFFFQKQFEQITWERQIKRIF